jgi:riboflavin kinase/FMN adenylyltransferase
VKVLRGLEEVPAAGRAIAIGSFDGVHRGHREVIGRAVAAAAERDLRAGVVTFEPHPMTVLRPELAPRELSTPARKAELVAELGPDDLIVVRFDLALSQVGHEEFAERILRGEIGARYVVVGSNFRYGHRAQGSIATLVEAGDRVGFEVEVVGLEEAMGTPVSSSQIRDLIAAGHVEQAAGLLGRPPWLEGEVVRGDARGREIGFPTANLELAPRSVVPALGIYAGYAHLPGRSRPAAISIGYNPTFSDERKRVRVEAHLLDFAEQVYGEPIRLDLTARLRDELRFGSVEELVGQIARDVEAVRALTAVG